VCSATAKIETVTKKNVVSSDNVVMNESLLIDVNDVSDSMNEFWVLETDAIEWTSEKLNFVENKDL
jgi:enamine deaminase RidA (YjgF/YER057c/UK114 family)